MKTLSFEGSGFEYFKIWVVNILLIVVTFGLYYPWAKVRKQRYFYANSTLENRNFEYHATGKQLFIGYLIAMALFIVYAVIQSTSPVGSGIVVLLFITALPWIIWRSLKFNMRMTSFSNVRFGFDGALGGAYINYLLLPILGFLLVYGVPTIVVIFLSGLIGSLGTMSSVLTGLVIVVFIFVAVGIFAYLKKRNTSYAINGFKYGQGVFSTQLKTEEFAFILLKTAGLSLLLFIVYFVLLALFANASGVFEILLSASASLDDPEAMQEIFTNGGVMMILGFVYIGFIFISLIAFAYSYARQRAYIFSRTRLDKEIKFSSTLKARPLAWVSVTNLLAIIFTLGLAVPWANVRMARLVLENTQVNSKLDLDGYVTQKQEEQSSLGEQIGDAFDVDIDIGI